MSAETRCLHSDVTSGRLTPSKVTYVGLTAGRVTQSD